MLDDMTEQRPDHDDTQPIRESGQVHRYPTESGYPSPGYGGGSYGFGDQHGYPYGPVAPERPGPSRPSGLVTAGVLVAALFAGSLGGLIGAAGFTAVDQLDETSSTATEPGNNSTVVDRDDKPADPGSIEEIADSVLPSVVKINVRGTQGMGSGSGVIISSDGEILTNDHVVALAQDGGRMTVSFNDGTTSPAEIVGTDPLTDLAVIRATGVSGLAPAKLGESSNLDVGEQVVAIGSPFGLEATVTTGIVSALNRPVSIGRSGEDVIATTYPAIQTDAAINPGNSGGPLVNMDGEVVGINSSIRSSSSLGEGGSIGLGFAIPLDKVLPIVDQLRAGEAPTHARLGVSVTDAMSTDGLLSGAGINSVSDGSAAEEAGLRAGDIVTSVDGVPISGSEALVATIRGYRPGDTVTLSVVREGEEITLDATLDSDEGTPSS